MVSDENASVPEFVIDPPELMVIVPALGLKFPLLPTVRAPTIVKPLAVVTVADAPIVNALGVNVPELVIDEPLFMVIVPPEGTNTEPEPIVSTPPTLKLLSVVTVAEFATVRAEKVSVPELVIDEPLFMVIVPPDGVSVPDTTFRAPATIAVVEPVTEPLTVSPPYVRLLMVWETSE